MADQDQNQQMNDHSPANSGKSSGAPPTDNQTAPGQPSPTEAQTQSAPAPAASKATPPDESPAKKTGRTVLIFSVVLLLILGAGFWYYESTFTEDTDDAQVDGDIYQVSSRISGQVTKVFVEDNKAVQKGDLLLEIDPKDYQVALEQANAQLASAQADYVQANVNVPITSTSTQTTLQNSGVDVSSSQTSVSQAQQQEAAAAARVEQATANAIKADKDVERYTPLVEKDVISRQQYDAAVASARSANASVLEAQKNVTAQQAAVQTALQRVQQARNQAAEAKKNGPEQVKVQQARAASALASVKQAQARVDQAKLNLSYTRVIAPTSGIINKKNVESGGNLSVGQDLLTIVRPRQSMGDRKLQRDAAQQDASLPAGSVEGGRAGRPQVLRQGHANRGRDRFSALAFPARECDRKLRQGGAAYSGAHRLHEPEAGERRLPPASRILCNP